MIATGFDNVTYMIAAVVGLTIVTFVTRSLFFVLPPSVRIPPAVERALRFAPACALTAIIAPTMFARNGDVFISWHNHHMWALLAATAFFIWRRNLMWAMVVAMAVFTVLRLWG
jgi:branched-subunit amino acid transport protein